MKTYQLANMFEKPAVQTLSLNLGRGPVGYGIPGMCDWAGEKGSFDGDASGGCAAGLFSNAHTVMFVLLELT